jgi:hypothetical protein
MEGKMQGLLKEFPPYSKNDHRKVSRRGDEKASIHHTQIAPHFISCVALSKKRLHDVLFLSYGK